MLNKFSFLQKLRNKIKIKSDANLSISTKAKIVNCNIYIKGENCTLTIGDNTVLRNCTLEIMDNNSSILFNKCCMVGDNSYLSAKEGKSIIIGDNCALSRNVKVMTSDGHPIYDQEDQRINHAKNIILDEQVWIADNVTILKGVKIGSNSMIGINSTVTKSIPNNCLAVGIPATIKKENIYWKDKI